MVTEKMRRRYEWWIKILNKEDPSKEICRFKLAELLGTSSHRLIILINEKLPGRRMVGCCEKKYHKVYKVEDVTEFLLSKIAG